MERVQIRRLETSDFDAYAGLRMLGLETDPSAFWASKEETTGPEFREKFESLMRHDFNFTLGAFEGERLLGMMTFIRYSQYKVAFKGDIVGVYLHPDARGKKIGDQLLREVIDAAFSIDGLTKITLAVTAGNDIAKKLYEKHGFEVYGFEKKGMRVGERYYDQYFMDLNKPD